jgi:membrane-associated phospholipid phosphatase
VELPRPTVPVLVDADTCAFPSRPMSALAITLYVAGFVLLPRGRGRNRLRAGIVAGLVLVGLAELYLAAEYLSGMLYAAILAPCVADVTFCWLAPRKASRSPTGGAATPPT